MQAKPKKENRAGRGPVGAHSSRLLSCNRQKGALYVHINLANHRRQDRGKARFNGYAVVDATSQAQSGSQRQIQFALKLLF
jgi:hypothetical protein